MRRKFVLPVALLLTASIAFVGCSKDGKQGAADGGEKVTLTVTSWRAEELEHEVYKEILQEFHKIHPNIDLDFKPVKATEYNTALNTALQTDTAADIIHLRPYIGARTLADSGYLEPIDGLNGLDVFSEDYLRAAQGSDGKQYGVPHMLSSTQILYNKKIFEENQLQEPKTWDELINIAKTLKEKNITPFAFGSKEGWVLTLMHGAIGPQFYGPDFVDKFLKGEAKLNGPEFVKSIEALYNLEPYFPDNYTGLGMDDIRTIFATEQAAMVINGHFEIPSIMRLNEDLQLDAFPVPPVDASGKPTISTWVDGSFGINAKSKYKEEAKKFLEFMTTKEYGSIILNKLNSPTPIPGVSTEDPLTNKLAQLAQTSGVPYFAVTFLGGGSPTTKGTIENEMQGMFLKQVNAQQVGDAAQAHLETWFTPSK